MIEVEHLTKDYGTVVAIRDVSFHVGRGEVVGVLGPNGAGKTTSLRIISGFLGATSGTVRVNGYDIFEQSMHARRSLGYMPESPPLYPEMRVEEFLRYRAALKGVARTQRRSFVQEAMEQARVRDVALTLIGHLSKGYRQRVALADALVAKPPLLILDEPTSGLDPNQIRDVRQLIRALAEEHTVLLSTHILGEVESTCDRAVVIHHGQLVAEGPLNELRQRQKSRRARLVVRDPKQETQTRCARPEIHEATIHMRQAEAIYSWSLTFAADVDPAAELERLVADLAACGVGIREAALTQASLEDVFAQLTGATVEGQLS